MKNILLYFFICITTCTMAQSFERSFIAADEYGVAASFSNTDPTVSVYPNPTADFIIIEDKENKVVNAHLFNLLGKEIATFPVNGLTKYDMMDFHKGIYLVQLKDANAQIIQTIRIKKI